MADTVYRVVVKYDTDTGGAQAGVRSMTSGFGGLAVVLNQTIELAKSVVGGISSVTKSMIGLQSRAESMRLALGGMLMAGKAPGATGMNQALALSDELIQKMIKDAAVLPGTFEELMEITQRLVLPSLQSGKSANAAEKISGQAMAVGKAFGIDAVTIGRETAAMLEGHAHAANVMWAKLRGTVGLTSEEFNKLTNTKRFEKIQEAFTKFQPMIDAYGDSWDAVSSTTESYFTQLFRAASRPLFGDLKDVLKQVNAGFEANKDVIASWATSVGQSVSQAFRFFREFFTDGAKMIGVMIDELTPLTMLFDGLKATLRGIGDLLVTISEGMNKTFSYFMSGETGFMLAKRAGLVPGGATWEEYKNAIMHPDSARGGTDLDATLATLRGLTITPGTASANPLDLGGKMRTSSNVTNNYNNIRIENTINDAENPDRVLIDVRKALEMALYHPTESAKSISASIR